MSKSAPNARGARPKTRPSSKLESRRSGASAVTHAQGAAQKLFGTLPLIAMSTRFTHDAPSG
jgi:hypothetical protein